MSLQHAAYWSWRRETIESVKPSSPHMGGASGRLAGRPASAARAGVPNATRIAGMGAAHRGLRASARQVEVTYSPVRSSPGGLVRMCASLSESGFPWGRRSGAFSPPYGEPSDEVDFGPGGRRDPSGVTGHRPGGLGAPEQELWMKRTRGPEFRLRSSSGVGAVRLRRRHEATGPSLGPGRRHGMGPSARLGAPALSVGPPWVDRLLCSAGTRALAGSAAE